MANVGFLELLLALLIVVAGTIHAALKARRPERIGLTDISIWFVAIFFGVGPWVAVFSGGVLPDEDPIILLLSYLSIILFMGGILTSAWIIGMFVRYKQAWEPGEDRRGLAPVMAAVANIHVPVLLALFAASVVIKIYIGIKYRQFFSGDQMTILLPIPYPVQAALNLSLLFSAAAFFWGAVTVCAHNARYRTVAWVVIGVGLALSFTAGRRWLMADAFLLSLCYFMYRGITFRTFFVSLVVGAILIFLAMPFFWRVRYYRQQNAVTDNAVMSVVSAAKRAATDWDNEQLREAYRMNMASRPMFIRFNMGIIRAQQTHRPMMGALAKNVLLWSTPYIFYEDKRLLVEPETAIQEFYGMPRGDTSSNWPAYGVADFGMLGALLIGILYGLIIGTVEVIAAAASARLPLLALCIIGLLLSSVTSVEEAPIHLLTGLRNLIGIVPFFLVLLPFLRKHGRAGGQSQGGSPGPWSDYGLEREPAR